MRENTGTLSVPREGNREQKERKKGRGRAQPYPLKNPKAAINVISSDATGLSLWFCQGSRQRRSKVGLFENVHTVEYQKSDIHRKAHKSDRRPGHKFAKKKYNTGG